MEMLKTWYLGATNPKEVNFKTMFIASLAAKGNIFMAQLIGAALVGVAFLLGDDGDGAFNKYITWQLFVVALCAISARSHKYFSFMELDKGYHSILDRCLLAGLNFLLVWQWADSFLHPSFGLFVSICYAIFSFFLFAPKKDREALKV
ncbi:MAG: hypothetical protein ABJN04_01475 [Hyphomicrobiales bacterium]